jgi:TPR repeat protein
VPTFCTQKLFKELIKLPKHLRLVCVCWFALTGQAIADSLSDAQNAYAAGNYASAERLFRPLAEQGSVLARYNIGKMYYLGQGVPQDYVEAMKWSRLAADQGNSLAQHNLGVMYYLGQGVLQDYMEAAKWFRLAAEQGNASAQNNLGKMYYLGQGVPQDNKEAAKWFRSAAEQGNAKAQVELGVLYMLGHGVSQDNIQALMWINVATVNDSAIQKQFTEIRISDLHKAISNRMTAEQVSLAQQLGEECTENKFKGCY